jgi:hypothetical protein
MSEETILGEQQGIGRQEALKQIELIKGNPKHEFWNSGPGHETAVKEWSTLHKAAFPDDPASKNMLEPQKRLYGALTDAGITEEKLKQTAHDAAEKAESQARNRAMEELRDRFGSETDAMVADAQAIVNQYCTPADRAFLDETGLGNDAEVLALLADLAKHIKRGQKGRKGR